MIHSITGELNFQRYGKDDTEYINAVSRAELNKSLMNLSEKIRMVKIYFNERCSDINFKNAEVSFHNETTNVISKIKIRCCYCCRWRYFSNKNGDAENSEI